MKRFDLRPLKDNFYDRMLELMDKEVSSGENAIFLFEIGDFSGVQKSADVVLEAGYTLMNSLKFNEVDWTIVVKKEKDVELIEKKRKEAEEKAALETKKAEQVENDDDDEE
ncbi:NADH-ubiquinone oxidoreductase subunit E family protein [Halarcobacter sp.]|uniref:NADH-ubiquinone oxidoreductase subunit E family protein n=1 Tax=Halarcobacter sp. TaxID=2321133 RepID=UPI002AAC306C|nr:NADH-ubiquinone oxidoreductase subunit E family protein [Halarcobacter sp.]|eukprot:Anaeramoba_ignava/a94893_31.p1 GENE.a94893_31~~a94893_31.p1  ORF type:complete len:111 (+),score=34.29 a94893_31:285-617(+)